MTVRGDVAYGLKTVTGKRNHLCTDGEPVDLPRTSIDFCSSEDRVDTGTTEVPRVTGVGNSSPRHYE